MTKIAIAVLCVLVGTLAYFAATSRPNTHMQEASWFRVRSVPPVAPEEIQRESNYLSNVAKEVNKVPLFIGGKEVVLTKQDQRTLSHAQMRRVYGMHE